MKLTDLGLCCQLCNWIYDFLSDRTQTVRIGNLVSSPLVINTGAPQGCVLSPLLYSLYTYDCKPRYDSNIIIKFADDTTVIGLISDDDESAYRDDVNHLVRWCASNDLVLNVSKTKEIVVDFRKSKSVPSTLIVNNSEVEIVDSFKFWGFTSPQIYHGHYKLGTCVKKRSTTSIFSALPQEVSYETRNPSQFLSQYYRKHTNRVDNGMVWQHDRC